MKPVLTWCWWVELLVTLGLLKRYQQIDKYFSHKIFVKCLSHTLFPRGCPRVLKFCMWFKLTQKLRFKVGKKLGELPLPPFLTRHVSKNICWCRWGGKRAQTWERGPPLAQAVIYFTLITYKWNLYIFIMFE